MDAIADGLRYSKAVSMPQLVPGAEPSWWFLRLLFNSGAIICDKTQFCNALIAEGLQICINYEIAMPHRMSWYKNRKVFGSSGLPWSSPMYRGDANRVFPCPNATQSIFDHFNLVIYESWDEEEIDDAVAVFRKVEAAYAR